MGHSKADNPRLGEVKAVLERLQKISDEPEAPGLAGLENDAHQARAATHRGASAVVAIATAMALILLGTYVFFNFDRLARTTARQASSPVAKTTTGVVPGGTAAQLPNSPASPWTAELPVPPRTADPPAPPPPTPLPTAELPVPPTPQATLQAALGLMTIGRVQAARSELLRMAPEDSADVAWALARSYDPNFLGTLMTADAGPDIAQATRWYRAWYAIAVKQGLVADSVSLERIIRSMR